MRFFGQIRGYDDDDDDDTREKDRQIDFVALCVGSFALKVQMKREG